MNPPGDRSDRVSDRVSGGLLDGKPARVVLVGAHGHGRIHRQNLQRLEPKGIARLAGVCDLRPLAEAGLDGAAPDRNVPFSPSLPDLIELVDPDIVLVATPIHTHLDLTLTAARAGRAVLLEKPPTATLAQFHELAGGVAATGVPCQIGFQSLGSDAIAGALRLIADGAIGAVTGIGGAGTWVRDTAYFSRAGWAGKRRLGDLAVTDGALTNPFGHLVATALALADADGVDDVREVELELFHGYHVESDDTATARIRTAAGVPITLAVTLCASRHRLPFVMVHGTHGCLTLRYTRDLLTLDTADGRTPYQFERTDLLSDLVARLRDPGHELLVPPQRAGGFMQVLEAVRVAADPQPIPAEFVQVSGPASNPRHAVRGIDQIVLSTARTLRTFAEQDVPWARTAAGSLR